MTALLRAYRIASMIVLPFAAHFALRKLRRFGVPALRAQEKLGHATLQKPLGDLIWVHAASVGEAKSSLLLIERLLAMAPYARVLITTGTATAAQVLEPRLPPRAEHQFAPLDAPGPVGRFLNHWQPRLALFIESELWPNVIDAAHQRGVAMGLLNARLSQRSARRWAGVSDTARHVLGRFQILHCQDQQTEKALKGLGLAHAQQGLNLKSAMPDPTFDEVEKARLKKAIAGRPVWAAVSTHPGEEEIAIAAHKALQDSYPKALMILVPRHPERAPDILRLCADQNVRRRSAGENPAADTSIYLADTLGETDLWFALTGLATVFGSFSDVGGHTPFEPAAHGAAILHGPRYANFSEVYAQFDAAGAATEVTDAGSLAAALARLIDDPQARAKMGAAARPLVAQNRAALDDIALECLNLADIAHD